MKYCHNCGAPLADDVRFCTACGSPLDPPETEPAMPESAVMPEMPEPAPEMPVMPGEDLPPEPPKKRKKRIWLWILLPVVVLALAAGAFVQGSSIELSADGPIRPPYAVYFQGGLTWFHGKLGILLSMQKLADAGIIKL